MRLGRAVPNRARLCLPHYVRGSGTARALPSRHTVSCNNGLKPAVRSASTQATCLTRSSRQFLCPAGYSASGANGLDLRKCAASCEGLSLATSSASLQAALPGAAFPAICAPPGSLCCLHVGGIVLEGAACERLRPAGYAASTRAELPSKARCQPWYWLKPPVGASRRSCAACLRSTSRCRVGHAPGVRRHSMQLAQAVLVGV